MDLFTEPSNLLKPSLDIAGVSNCGNPWMKEKCEECNQQIMSYRNLGVASFFDKDDEDPWKTGKSESILRFVCNRCSEKLGYDEGY